MEGASEHWERISFLYVKATDKHKFNSSCSIHSLSGAMPSAPLLVAVAMPSCLTSLTGPQLSPPLPPSPWICVFCPSSPSLAALRCCLDLLCSWCPSPASLRWGDTLRASLPSPVPVPVAPVAPVAVPLLPLLARHTALHVPQRRAAEPVLHAGLCRLPGVPTVWPSSFLMVMAVVVVVVGGSAVVVDVLVPVLLLQRQLTRLGSCWCCCCGCPVGWPPAAGLSGSSCHHVLSVGRTPEWGGGSGCCYS